MSASNQTTATMLFQAQNQQLLQSLFNLQRLPSPDSNVSPNGFGSTVPNPLVAPPAQFENHIPLSVLMGCTTRPFQPATWFLHRHPNAEQLVELAVQSNYPARAVALMLGNNVSQQQNSTNKANDHPETFYCLLFSSFVIANRWRDWFLSIFVVCPVYCSILHFLLQSWLRTTDEERIFDHFIVNCCFIDSPLFNSK